MNALVFDPATNGSTAQKRLSVDGSLNFRLSDGLVADAGGVGFMRGLASVIPGQADPSAVASGPTGARMYPWDSDGSYGD